MKTKKQFGLSFMLGAVALVMGLMSAMPTVANVPGGGGGGGGCYNPSVLECGSYGTFGGGQQQICNFSGVYGPPYNCTEVPCYNSNGRIEHRCVEG